MEQWLKINCFCLSDWQNRSIRKLYIHHTAVSFTHPETLVSTSGWEPQQLCPSQEWWDWAGWRQQEEMHLWHPRKIMPEDCQAEALGFGTRKSEGRQHGAELAATASCSISWWVGVNSLKRWIVEDFLPLPHKKTNFCSERCTKGSRWTFSSWFYSRWNN